tara:strand:+ start:3927 stop:4604 length:678 start_codon:yes stop_codon:yes gene_type:complete
MEIRDGYMYCDDKLLGKCDALIADSKELPSLTEGQGVVHISTPYRIDLLFCAGDKIVGVECKKPEDFINSWQGRRLARQVKTMLAECDVSVIAVKGVLSTAKPYKPVNWERIWLEVVGWQMAGVLVLEVPESDGGVLRYMAGLKQIINSTNPPARALAGTDVRVARERRPGWLLRRIPTIGPSASNKLMDNFKSVGNVLSATDKQLRKAGLNKKQVIEIRKALNE